MEKIILLAVDGSSGANNAIDYMLSAADPTHAAVILAYVIEWSPYSFNTPEENAERHQRRESEISRANEQVIAPVKEALEKAGFKVATIVRHGAPAETLIRIAHDFEASEIVFGRRGQSGIKSLLFGSVAGSLIQTSDIPIVIVP